jgi:hypothetical protein
VDVEEVFIEPEDGIFIMSSLMSSLGLVYLRGGRGIDDWRDFVTNMDQMEDQMNGL